MQDDQNNTKIADPYEELVTVKLAYLFCDACGFYYLEPVHGHFVYPSCYNQTRCCEGAPIDV